ncbi:MAG: hypothetical protein HUJ75_05635 [Parasporobacterium sp.]|nr:hypothetical protein [Parasporobacterium sp.]
MFKRAEWHSGLTYHQTCPNCHTWLSYTDKSLDFRPWFPDGFVYCPKCKKPLRHNENYAVNADGTPYYADCVPRAFQPGQAQAIPQPQAAQAAAPEGNYMFCAYCGKRYEVGARFCPGCGKELPQE